MFNVKSAIFGALIILAAAGGFWVLTQKNTNIPPIAGYEYFWGDGCPHCAVVAEFLATWEGKDKIKIEKKEVWKNTANSRVLGARAVNCGIPKDELGVPLLVTPEGQCIVGDQPIIEHLKNLDKDIDKDENQE